MEDQTPQPGANAKDGTSDTPAKEEPQVDTETSPAEPQDPDTPAPEQETTPEYTAHVEQTGPCARLVRIEIPQEIVVDEIDKSYLELRNTVFIKGFRKGHVPRHVLERRFGEQVLESVRQTLVDDHFAKATEDNNLDLALPPGIDYDAITLDPNAPLTYELNIEIVPEFTIDNYKGIEVARPPIDITDDDVARALDAFRTRHGQYTKIDEGTLTETDVPVCHATALIDGEEIWRQTELGAHLRDETIGGMKVPGLHDALINATTGDSKTLTLTLPDQFPEEAHRGKTADLEITIDEIRRFTAPEPTDEWAKSLDFDDLDDLRDEISDELRRTRTQEADDAVTNRIADRLLELTDFDVPDGLVERLVTSAKDRQRLSLLYRGTPEDQIDAQLAQDDQTRRDTSVRSCKLHFIYSKLAELEKIYVTEEEIQQRIQAIALNYRRPPAEVEAELESQGRLASLRQEMRDEKVRDFLVQNADITDEAPADAPAEPDPAAETTLAEPPADDGGEDAEE